MRTVSAAFIAAIRDSHKLATRATVIDPSGNETIIEVKDATVTLDQTAAVRGRCDITVVDDGTFGLVPTDASSLLAPYGNEIRLERGIEYPDGTVELVSLGVFGIQDATVTDSQGSLEIRVSGLDRAQRFIDAKFEEPYNVTAGTNFRTAILTALQAAWPDVPHDLTTTALNSPAVIAQEGDDRWKFCQDMATAIGMRLYFDGDGTLRMVPTVLGEPVETLAEGENGVLLDAGRRWTREDTFNRVIATGENVSEDTPARGVATDNDPQSPTYYYGPFGKVPRFYTSSFITTDAQALAAATGLLINELGTSEQVDFGTLVLPHVEPGDTVRITRERAGIDEDHVIDSVTIPFAPSGAMSGRTRARRVT